MSSKIECWDYKDGGWFVALPVWPHLMVRFNQALPGSDRDIYLIGCDKFDSTTKVFKVSNERGIDHDDGKFSLIGALTEKDTVAELHEGDDPYVFYLMQEGKERIVPYRVSHQRTFNFNTNFEVRE